MIKKNLIGFQPISKGVCTIRSKGRFPKGEDCTGSHGPQRTIVLEEEDREEWEEDKKEEENKNNTTAKG